MSSNHSGIVTQNWSSVEVALSSFALTLVNILAVSGNLLVMFVVSYTKELHGKESNWFVMNLALADLLVSLTVIPISIDTLIRGTFRHGSALKEFTGFANFLFCICSIMSLQLLSLDRWFAIAKPFKYLEVISPRKAFAACLFVWIYSTVCALPPKFGVSSYYCFIPNLDVCDLNRDWSGSYKTRIFAIAVIGLSYFVALIIMAMSYWKIFQITRSHVRKINAQLSLQHFSQTNRCWEDTERVSNSSVANVHNTNETSTKSSRRKKWWNSSSNRVTFSRASDIQTTTTFLIVIGVYFLCWTPFCVTLVLDIIMDKKVNSAVTLVCLWIGYANSCVNPLIYTWKYKQFRHAFVAICKRFYERVFITSTRELEI